jgi:hypothetical protein
MAGDSFCVLNAAFKLQEWSYHTSLSMRMFTPNQVVRRDFRNRAQRHNERSTRLRFRHSRIEFFICIMNEAPMVVEVDSRRAPKSELPVIRMTIQTQTKAS